MKPKSNNEASRQSRFLKQVRITRKENRDAKKELREVTR